MLQVLILICSTSVAPSDCTPDTALDLINGPAVESLHACAMGAQVMLASTAQLGQRPNEYVKIRCGPGREERTAQKL
ncbi:MAG TPA: hypothetical protein VIU14_16530 [Mesorhizobium sp.]|jgi:hypothetical protein